MNEDTEREALIRILVEVERGKMTEVEWKVASLTPANGIRADAILAEFMPDHDIRVRAEQRETDALIVEDEGFWNDSPGHLATAIREASDE